MYGVPNAESYEVPHGVRAVDIMRMLKPEWNEAQVAEGLRVIEDMEIEDTGDLTVLPGAKALLEQLPPERWAIVTSATRRLLLGRLAAAGLPVPERIDLRRHGGAGQARSGALPARRGVAGACAGRVRGGGGLRLRALARAWRRAAACWACWGRTTLSELQRGDVDCRVAGRDCGDGCWRMGWSCGLRRWARRANQLRFPAAMTSRAAATRKCRSQWFWLRRFNWKCCSSCCCDLLS